jgi:ribosomal protein S1
MKAAVPIGSKVSGRVTACAPFGVFVDLGLGFPGLLELPEFADAAPRPQGVTRLPAVGDQISAWVLQHDDHNRQLRLTQRAQTGEQWEQIRAFRGE